MKGLAPPRLPDSESGPSAIRVEPHARELVHPAGLPPANSPFEAEDDCNFTTDAEMVGCLGFAPSSRRLRAGTSLAKFATQANAKAELNRRGQTCEVLIDTGISRRGKCKVGSARCADRAPPRGVHYQDWTGIGVSRPVLRFGRPACISQHLCPKNWSPVRELHLPECFCRPLPEWLAQRDKNQIGNLRIQFPWPAL